MNRGHMLRVAEFSRPLAEQLADPREQPPAGEVAIYWLGQAGFAIDFGGLRILVDPYLSDSLARKYKGTRYGHVRLMASPIAPEQFTRLDLVLCTHRHTDHMDPDTLRPLAKAFPELRFVVPAASIAEARRRCGVDDERLIPVNAGDDIRPLLPLRVRPVAAAHETINVDASGRHEWLGYVMDIGTLRLYHSGDCIPYDGLNESIAQLAPDLALLPVNGRDPERSGNGVPGNFTLDEAVGLCRAAGVSTMVAHHYGLFEFNTVSPATVDARAQREASDGFDLQRARVGVVFRSADLRPSAGM